MPEEDKRKHAEKAPAWLSLPGLHKPALPSFYGAWLGRKESWLLMLENFIQREGRARDYLSKELIICSPLRLEGLLKLLAWLQKANPKSPLPYLFMSLVILFWALLLFLDLDCWGSTESVFVFNPLLNAQETGENTFQQILYSLENPVYLFSYLLVSSPLLCLQWSLPHWYPMVRELLESLYCSYCPLLLSFSHQSSRSLITL